MASQIPDLEEKGRRHVSRSGGQGSWGGTAARREGGNKGPMTAQMDLRAPGKCAHLIPGVATAQCRTLSGFKEQKVILSHFWKEVCHRGITRAPSKTLVDVYLPLFSFWWQRAEWAFRGSQLHCPDLCLRHQRAFFPHIVPVSSYKDAQTLD